MYLANSNSHLFIELLINCKIKSLSRKCKILFANFCHAKETPHIKLTAQSRLITEPKKLYNNLIIINTNNQQQMRN